jgi:arylsulfatase A-like enzyme
VLALLLAGSVWACGQSEGPAAEARRPNIVLVVVDTLRADHVGGYGYERDTTPTIDGWMRQGVRFDAAIAPSSWSAPSHTTIITGALPTRHQVMGWGQAIAADVRPMAAVLSDHGYATGLFSSHFALHVAVAGITQGLDAQLVTRNEDDERVLAEAAAWVRTARQPYFLYLCLMTPHAPYNKYPASYDETLFTDMPLGGEAVFPFTGDAWIGRGGIPRSVRLGSHDRLGFYVNRYDRSVRYADDLLGRFFDELRAADLLEDTIVVLTSDHGEGLGDHDAFAHELYLYDFLVRVPLIVAWPGRIPAGQRWDAQVSLADIVPTALGLAAVPAPSQVDGRDLSQWLRSGTRPDERRLLTAIYRWRGFDRYMVRSDRYKLIRDAGTGQEELYDLIHDPGEMADLRAGGPLPEAYATLRAELDALVARHAAIDPERVDVAPDAAVLERLDALGYVRAGER